MSMAGTLQKNIHYLWNAPAHLQKSSTYTSFKDAFQINLVTETHNRHRKPETKTIQNAPLLYVLQNIENSRKIL